jgi:hypothetical protein
MIFVVIIISMTFCDQQFKRNASHLAKTQLVACIPFLLVCFVVFFLSQSTQSAAQSAPKSFSLQVPAALQVSGLMRHILPRFSLKTGVWIIMVVESDAADMVFTSEPIGMPVFEGPTTVWYLKAVDSTQVAGQRFEEWLRSDIGLRAVTSFERDGVALFTAASRAQPVAAKIQFSGDALLGAKLSAVQCSRCHVVSEATRMTSIGSTPSFFLLRALEDWDLRFLSFYALNPHPAFTQIAEVTDPFDPARPSPIVPVEITIDELEAIVAYVSGLPPADLGPALVHQ